MSSIYVCQDETIGFYEHKIDLLRGEYAYDHIDYSEIKRIRLEKGHIKNWILLMIFGLGMIFSALVIALYVYNNSQNSDLFNNLLTFWKGSRGFGIMVILFLIAFGIYSIWVSLRSTVKMIIETNKYQKQFEIREIHRQQKLNYLADFLKERVPIVLVDEKLIGKILNEE